MSPWGGDGDGDASPWPPLLRSHDAAVLDRSPWRQSPQQRRPEGLTGLREDADETEDHLLPHRKGAVRYPHASFLLLRLFPCIGRIKGLLRSSCLVPC